MSVQCDISTYGMAQKHLRHSWDVMPDSIKKYQRQKNKENKRLEVVEILDRRLFNIASRTVCRGLDSFCHVHNCP